MYFTFYIDQFFLEQVLTGALLLAVTARLRRQKVSWKRLLAGSAGNAAVATALICLRRPGWAVLGVLPACAITLPAGNRKELWKNLRMMAFVTVCFGGLLEALVALAPLPLLFGTLAAAVLAERMGRWMERHGRQAGIVPVRLQWQERTEIVQGLIDSGNQLTEPLTGKPVSIIGEASAGRLLGEHWEERCGCFFIPYHSIGIEKGYLLGVTIDRMDVGTGENLAVFHRPLLAIYKGEVSAGKQYQMILHPLHSALQE